MAPSKERESCEKKNARFTWSGFERRTHNKKKDRSPVYYLCATAFMLKLFSAIKLKRLQRWIWHFHIFSYFRKYFLKIFLKSWYQTYFHFYFLFLMKMEIGNSKPNTPLVYSLLHFLSSEVYFWGLCGVPW